MGNFYDLNDFIAFLLRKLKVIVIIALIGIIGFAGIRFKGLYAEYQKSKNQPQQTTTVANTQEPMKCWAEVVINVLPNYEIVGETTMDRGNEIAAYYSSLRTDANIMQEMHDKYFEKAKVYGDKMRELMSTYGYILDKEKNYKYVDYDFQRQFAVTINNNYVTIGFYSLDTEFSKQVVNDYTDLLNAKVEEQYPNFEYTKASESIRYELPEVSSGAAPTRVSNGGSAAPATMTMETVIKQTIKGCVWGLMIGLVLALVVVFLQYMMSRKMILWSQMHKNGITNYGLLYRKKAGVFGRAKRKCIAALEGNRTCFEKEEQLAELVVADLEKQLIGEETVFVCGAEDNQIVERIVESLNGQKSSLQFELMESPLKSSKGIQAAEKTGHVILVEVIGVTLKNDIEQKLHAFNNYGVKVIGIIGAE